MRLRTDQYDAFVVVITALPEGSLPIASRPLRHRRAAPRSRTRSRRNRFLVRPWLIYCTAMSSHPASFTYSPILLTLASFRLVLRIGSGSRSVATSYSPTLGSFRLAFGALCSFDYPTSRSSFLQYIKTSSYCLEYLFCSVQSSALALISSSASKNISSLNVRANSLSSPSKPRIRTYALGSLSPSTSLRACETSSVRV
ncbi:hypothetical protein F5148DRAFT_528623 [Russula earlei]|uniref:Uncharacterized protein n=1 Tax=Russula earlei TaxID=71964 RepID=A0ACC0TWW4_9AGAM|nr:hypothetical protein F5148DRAFT_528623 [Russula earlei]